MMTNRNSRHLVMKHRLTERRFGFAARRVHTSPRAEEASSSACPHPHLFCCALLFPGGLAAVVVVVVVVAAAAAAALMPYGRWPGPTRPRPATRPLQQHSKPNTNSQCFRDHLVLLLLAVGDLVGWGGGGGGVWGLAVNFVLHQTWFNVH